MDNNTGFESNEFEGEDEDFEDEGDDMTGFPEPPPPDPKAQFQQTLSTCQRALQGIDTVYPQLIGTVQGFDKELARRLAACQAADRALLTYINSKAEQASPQQRGVFSTIVGLLSGR